MISGMLMIVSGLIMMVNFQSGEETPILSLQKAQWLSIHHFVSIGFILLLGIHLLERKNWIQQNIFKKTKSSRKNTLLKRNSISLFLSFLTLLLTGYISWFSGEECMICIGIHDKVGLLFTGLIGFHLIRNKYFNKKHFKF
jgi:uncharacterized membrane protein SirB2